MRNFAERASVSAAVITGLFLLAGAAPASDIPLSDRLHARAMEAFDRGVAASASRVGDPAAVLAFRTAAALFELQAGQDRLSRLDRARAWSAAGTCRALAEDRAEAVLAFRRSLSFAPALPSARENLEILRGRVGEQPASASGAKPTDSSPNAGTDAPATLPPASLRSLARTAAAAVPDVVASAGMVLAFALLVGWGTLRPLTRNGTRARRSLVWAPLMSVPLGVLAGLTLWLHRPESSDQRGAVIVARGVAGRAIPGYEAQTLETPVFSPGVEVRMFEVRTIAGVSWARVLPESDQSVVDERAPTSGDTPSTTPTATCWVPLMALERVVSSPAPPDDVAR